MMNAPSLVEIRRFLLDEGCAVEPWSSPEVVLQSLHDLLAMKRDDERFWARLKELARRLDARCFDPRALPDFDALGPVAVDRLVDELRRSVAPGRVPVREWLQKSAGLGAILVVVLGLTLSCDSSSEAPADVAPWSPDDWQCESVADSYAIDDADDRDALCELGDYVKGATVTEGTMHLMLDCLPGYDMAWRANLLEQFEGATAAELNAMITDLTSEGAACGPIYDDDDDFGSGGCDISAH